MARIKNEEINAINKKYEDEDSARKKQKAADEQAVQEATLGAVAGTLGSLSQLAGKEAASGKGIKCCRGSNQYISQVLLRH